LEERQAGAFAACVRNYVEGYAKPNTRNWRETARILGLDYPLDGGEAAEARGGLLQRWGEKPIHDIDGHEVWSVIDEARRISVPGIPTRNAGRSEARARGLFVALSSLFTWAQRHRFIEINPCRTLPRPAPAEIRDRVLTSDEIRWFWQASECADAPRVPGALKPFKAVLRLLLLTGQRLDEVASMVREELRDDGTWHLPGSRTKNKRPHVVPLPPLARDLIASMPDGPGFVFTTTGASPVQGWSRMKRRLDEAMLVQARKEREAKATIPPWRLHDLRRTAVTGMAELGIRPDVIELTVNHVSGSRGGIAGVYNRSQLLPERKAALESWALHVQGLVSGQSAQVVPLARKRGRE
jgi:integrase